MNAAAIEALLRRSGNLEANIGAVSLRPPASSGVPSAAPVTGPVLELSCNGAPLLAVSVQLRTGRLLLRGGDGAAANFSSLGQELAPLLRQVLPLLASVRMCQPVMSQPRYLRNSQIDAVRVCVRGLLESHKSVLAFPEQMCVRGA